MKLWKYSYGMDLSRKSILSLLGLIGAIVIFGAVVLVACRSATAVSPAGAAGMVDGTNTAAQVVLAETATAVPPVVTQTPLPAAAVQVPAIPLPAPTNVPLLPQAVINVTPVPPVSADPSNPVIYPTPREPNYNPAPDYVDLGVSDLPCGRRVTHIVERGQNLFRIAIYYRTTTSAIMRANGIRDVYSIPVGTRLTVNVCGRGYGYAPVPRGDRYVVQYGDTLFGIATRFGVNVATLCNANGIYGNLIVPGQALVIP